MQTYLLKVWHHLYGPNDRALTVTTASEHEAGEGEGMFVRRHDSILYEQHAA